MSTTYQEGVGIYHTSPLDCSDIGNVLDPAKRKGTTFRYCAPGTEGRMNSGLRDYIGDFRGPGNRLAPVEIRHENPDDPQAPQEGLAPLFETGTYTVARWFGLVATRQNCFPVSERGKRICNMAARAGTATDGTEAGNARGKKILNNRLRAFMAIPLVVEGGLQRHAVFTRGDPENAGLPFEKRFPFAYLDKAVEWLEAMYDGDKDGVERFPLSVAWVQLTIESRPTLDGWDVVVLYNMPALGDPSEEILPADD